MSVAGENSGRGTDEGGGTLIGPNANQPDLTLLMSYRFLRCGIVGAALVLIVGLTFEIFETMCVRNSISAYFYSPVRTVFTGGLMAVGLCLVILQGDSDLEEICLNMAGMFAPMVAVVPTSLGTQCDARFDGLDESGTRMLSAAIAASTREGLQNNLVAYFGVALFALLALLVFPHHFVRVASRIRLVRWVIAGYTVVVGIFAVAAWQAWDSSNSWAHNAPAILMFVAFGVVVAHNGWQRRQVPPWYAKACRRIVAAMVIAAVVWGVVIASDVRWGVFGLEATELLLFTGFWLLQTVVFWNRDSVSGQVVAVQPAG